MAKLEIEPCSEFSLLFFVLYALQFLLQWGLLYVGVQRAAGQTIHLGMLKQALTFNMFAKMLGTMLLMGVLLCVPTIPLFALGIYLVNVSQLSAHISAAVCFALVSGYVFFLAVKFYFVQTIAVTEQTNPWQAIKKSFQATRSNFWKLAGLSFINMWIMCCATLLLGIGLIWAIPYSYINNGIVYRRLVLKQAD